LSIVVYDLDSVTVPYFVDDMKVFEIFERTISETVFGVKTSMVQIMSIVSDERRLKQFLSRSKARGNAKRVGKRKEKSAGKSKAEATTTAKAIGAAQFLPPSLEAFRKREMPPKHLKPRRPPPAPRWLQAKPTTTYVPKGPTTRKYEVVRQPTPLEASGSKADGEAGGPKVHALTVSFRVLIGDDKQLAFRALREFDTVSTEAMTYQMDGVMGTLDMPRSYVVSIVGIDTYPFLAVAPPEVDNATKSNNSKIGTYSVAASQFGPRRFSLAWTSVMMAVVTGAHAAQWL